MSGWLIALIIIVAIAFILSTATALLKQGGFDFPDSYERPEKKDLLDEQSKDDDDKPSGFY